MGASAPTRIVQNDQLLEALPASYLRGLETIVLTNRSALSTDQRRTKTWSRNYKGKLTNARGWYQESWKFSPAVIYLCVNNILRSELPSFRRIPFLRYEALGTVLYHEIGHHIDAAVRPAYGGRNILRKIGARNCSIGFFGSITGICAPFSTPYELVTRLFRGCSVRSRLPRAVRRSSLLVVLNPEAVLWREPCSRVRALLSCLSFKKSNPVQLLQ